MTQRSTPGSIHVNGRPFAVSPGCPDTLLDFLLALPGLRGTKRACSAGTCGACTVLVDGVRMVACLTLTALVEGAHATTIEGLSVGTDCTPCSRRSWSAMPCNAAIARQGRS
jgi:xanthine dehydrogenase YagT iron-sulfur-binding subunit